MKAKKKAAEKGVLIYALGNANYYHMATALAASIKFNDPGLEICLVTDGQVQLQHEKLFDIVKAPTKKSILQNGNTEFIKAKLFMYDLSPFQETIFLDADQILIPGKQLSPVFDELKNVDLTLSNTGVAGLSIWADIEEVKSIYGNNPFWNYHSEFFYFKKCDTALQFFAAAIQVYEDNKITSAEKFANGTMADELAFQAASMITGIYPHEPEWSPNFWFDRYPKLSRKYPYELTNFITYSVGGKSVPAAVKKNYDTLVSHYFYKLGLQNPYKLINKMSFLSERQKF